MMDAAGEELHLARHYVGNQLLCTAGDVEGTTPSSTPSALN